MSLIQSMFFTKTIKENISSFQLHCLQWIAPGNEWAKLTPFWQSFDQSCVVDSVTTETTNSLMFVNRMPHLAQYSNRLSLRLLKSYWFSTQTRCIVELCRKIYLCDAISIYYISFVRIDNVSKFQLLFLRLIHDDSLLWP